jgi:hypothetical protein
VDGWFMTDKMYQKVFEIILRNSIEKSIETMNIDRNKQFDFVTLDEDFIEVSYSELVHEVKREFINKYGTKLDHEISELERKLKQC